MRHSILCGLDGSRESRAALEVAARLAEQLGLRLVLTHVTEPAHLSSAAVGPTSVRPPAAALLEVHEQVGERLLEHMAEEAGVADAERRVVVGFPAERLADLADEEEAELVVVGSRGRGAMRAAFLGSVSTSLIGVAPCPVLVVPAGAVELAG